jgi:hypothetical protein
MGDHPFTVMATGMNEEQAGMGYLDLAIKANGGLTKKLAELLHVDLEQEDLEDANPHAASLAVLVEGPYGSLHKEVSTLLTSPVDMLTLQHRCMDRTTFSYSPAESV